MKVFCFFFFKKEALAFLLRCRVLAMESRGCRLSPA
jgi:hypothetical protein